MLSERVRKRLDELNLPLRYIKADIVGTFGVITDDDYMPLHEVNIPAEGFTYQKLENISTSYYELISIRCGAISDKYKPEVEMLTEPVDPENAGSFDYVSISRRMIEDHPVISVGPILLRDDVFDVISGYMDMRFFGCTSIEI